MRNILATIIVLFFSVGAFSQFAYPEKKGNIKFNKIAFADTMFIDTASVYDVWGSVLIIDTTSMGLYKIATSASIPTSTVIASMIGDTADVLRGEWRSDVSDTADVLRGEWRSDISDTADVLRGEWPSDVSDTADVLRGEWRSDINDSLKWTTVGAFTSPTSLTPTVNIGSAQVADAPTLHITGSVGRNIKDIGTTGVLYADSADVFVYTGVAADSVSDISGAHAGQRILLMNTGGGTITISPAHILSGGGGVTVVSTMWYLNGGGTATQVDASTGFVMQNNDVIEFFVLNATTLIITNIIDVP